METKDVKQRDTGTHRTVNILVHVIFVVIICVLPEMLMHYASNGRHPDGVHWWFYAKSGIIILVFYANYFWIINRTVIRRRSWLRFILLNLLLVAVAAGSMYLINYTFGGHHPRHHDPASTQRLAMSLSFILRDAIMLVLSVALALALRLSGRWMDLERRREQMVAEQRRSELQSLRDQLNPHFLFNTLNSIYALIAISPREAQQAVHELSQLLRYVVYENPATVPLDRELDFINNYVQLMRLRLGDRPVEISISNTASRPIEVPPLLFVTLIENAFKHGVTARTDDAITISLQADNRRLTFTTTNHVQPARVPSKTPGGVGLANLRRRLELIYGRRASLATSLEKDIFRSTITLNSPCESADV